MSDHSPVFGRLFGAFSVSVILRFVRLGLNVLIIAMLGRYLGEGGIGKLLTARAIVSVLLCVAEFGFARISGRELPKRSNRR